MSGATSTPCISYENRVVVSVCTYACVCVCVIECKVQARLTPSLMVVIFGNPGYSLVRGFETFMCTSKRNYGD